MSLAVGAACIAMSVLLPGIGTVAAGELFVAGMGAISASLSGAINDYSSGNVRSLGEATRDMVISMIAGAVTGAIGAKFPEMHRMVEGAIDTAVSFGERFLYAVFDNDMSWEEKKAYVLNPKQILVDFTAGVVIGEILDRLTAGIQAKRRQVLE